MGLYPMSEMMTMNAVIGSYPTTHMVQVYAPLFTMAMAPYGSPMPPMPGTPLLLAPPHLPMTVTMSLSDLPTQQVLLVSPLSPLKSQVESQGNQAEL